MNVTGCFLPSPQTRPSPTASFQRSAQYPSGTPNVAIAPVCGDGNPILISRPIAADEATVALTGATVAGVAAPMVAVVAPVVVVTAPPHAATSPPKPAPTP